MSQAENQHKNPEVVPKAKRRQFTAEYKRQILKEYEACTESGEKGALLRREGLYSSHIITWRRQREQGELAGLGLNKRGPKGNPHAVENARLQRENERLKKRLEQAELIIEVQKKVSQILGINISEDRNGSLVYNRSNTSHIRNGGCDNLVPRLGIYSCNSRMNTRCSRGRSPAEIHIVYLREFLFKLFNHCSLCAVKDARIYNILEQA